MVSRICKTMGIMTHSSFYPWFCRIAVTMLLKAMTRNMASLITRSRKREKRQKITEIQISVKSFCETMLPHGSEGSRTAREKRRFCSFSPFCEKNFCKTMLPLICKTMGKMTRCVFLPMVLQVLQDYASFSSLQNYASF